MSDDTGPLLGWVLPREVGWLDVAASGADSVELKILLAPGDDVLERVYGPGPRRHRRRRMYLIDTVDLALTGAGVDLRLRRRGRDRHDLTVRSRLRGILGSQSERPSPSWARVELDLLPGVVLWTTELRRMLDPALAARCVAGRLAPLRLLCADQYEWLVGLLDSAERSGAQDATDTAPRDRLDDLAVHGPMQVDRVRIPHERFPHARAHLEHGVYPSGRELVEFSARCSPARAHGVAAAADEFLAGCGVVPAGEHHTKTSGWVDELT